MTVDEAKTKWCPFARVTEAELDARKRGTAFNRMEDEYCALAIPPACMCIADECMAWRWDIGRVGDDPSKGYCGLARE